MNTRSLGLAAILSLASLAHGATTASSADHDYPPPGAGSYTLPVVKLAADGQVLDTHGRARTLAEFTRDRITVLSFIYTRCGAAKACPYATGVLKELHRASANDPELTRHLRLISLSFDPDFDTPEHLGHYARWAASQPAGCPWTFLTTRSQAELQPILTAYDQAVDRKRNPTDPLGPLNHTLRVYLIDADARIRNIYSSGTLDPRLVLADVQTLILEQQTPPTTPRDPMPPSQAILQMQDPSQLQVAAARP